MFFIAFAFVSCSSDGDNSSSTVNTPLHYFKFTIDGVEDDLANPDYLVANFTSGNVSFNGKRIIVGAAGGNGGDTDSQYQARFDFTSDGKLLYANLNFSSIEFQNPGFYNFIEYPSYFCQVDNFEIDQINKEVKIKFTVHLFSDKSNINSYSREIKADIKMPYEEMPQSVGPDLTYGGVEQYCKADINGQPWMALFERTYSIFTNEGPYRIETHFANMPAPGNFTFDSSSTDNYVRFAKFNTTTMTYDYYTVNGQVGYTYREFHGSTNYSFIGTYSFTAVNPLNPADVIQVTNGTFRSYQHF